MSSPRNPARIDPIIEALRHTWHANPDMRLTQLVWSLANPQDEAAPKFYSTEDTALHWAEVPVTDPVWEGGYRDD